LPPLLWPSNLIFTYPHWTIDASAWWQYLFPLGVVAVGDRACGRIDRVNRGPLAGFLFFAGTLFPVLGFSECLSVSLFLRRGSFSIPGEFGNYDSSGVRADHRGSPVFRPGMVPRLAPALLLLVLGVLTWRQSGIYSDVETLYQETLARNPASWMAHHNLGKALAEMPAVCRRRSPKYRAAISINPDFRGREHNNLGKTRCPNMSRETRRRPVASSKRPCGLTRLARGAL